VARHIRSAIRHGARAAALWLAGAAAALAQTFSFSGYSFDDSAYLSAQDLQSIARPYVNRPITFADVEALVAEVQARYAAAGIVTARVLIEPQEVAIGGILHLSLVEARLEALEVGETSRVKARLIRKSAPLVVGDKPDFDAIAETAQLFEVAHGARYVVDFAPGDAPETTRATAKLVTAQALGWSAGADNQAAPTLGGQSATFGVSSFDRFDRLERISGSLSLNRGGQTLAGEYSFPLSVRMRGSVGVEVSQGAVVATVLGLPLSSVRLHEVFGTVSAQRRFGPSALQTSFGLAFGRSDSGGAVTSDGTYAMATRVCGSFRWAAAVRWWGIRISSNPETAVFRPARRSPVWTRALAKPVEKCGYLPLRFGMWGRSSSTAHPEPRPGRANS